MQTAKFVESDATKLRAPGTSITLDDGSEHRLKFTMDALWLLEEKYDGLDGVMAEINQKDKPSGWPKGKVASFRPIFAAALDHESIDENGARIPGKPTGLELTRRMGFQFFVRDVQALAAAFNQAMPLDDSEESDDPNAPGSASSPGTSSTTSPPLQPVAAMASSGG